MALLRHLLPPLTLAIGYPYMNLDTSKHDSPIHLLPCEILEEIFVQCLPFRPRISKDEAPLVLCSVCSSWRAVALNAPRLWNHISLNVIDLMLKGSQDSNSGVISPAFAFLKRSKFAPLVLQLEAPFPKLNDHPQWKTSLAKILSQSYHRLRSLEIHSSWLNHFIYSIQATTFPQLTTLTVSTSTDPSLDILSTPLLSFRNAPKLDQVIYRAYISYQTALNLWIPWGQLTHLTLENVDDLAWYNIFRQCKNLHSGSFVISKIEQTPPTVSDDITFPFLSCLSLRNIQTSPASSLDLGGFRFPALRVLELEWDYSKGFENHFLSYIQGLECLHICSRTFHVLHPSDLVGILSTTPNISELHLRNDNSCGYIFDSLIYHSYMLHPLLPQLKTLVIDMRSWSSGCDRPTTLSSLRKLVGSRWWVYPRSRVRRLERLCISNVSDESAEDIKTVLSSCTKNGFLLECNSIGERGP